jgi:beta-phosphoglucomutase
MLKACIFDLDGVLVDTAKYHFVAWQRLANQLGVEFTETDNEQLKGLSRDASISYILKKGNIVLAEQDKQHYMAMKNEWYLALVNTMDESEALPNAKELLINLKANNIAIALGSASKNARLILEQTALLPFFDSIVDGTRTTKSKPDPEVFLTAANDLSIHPKEAIVFEDAISGIQAANAGGFLSLGIGEPTVLTEAVWVYPNLTSLNFEQLINLYNSKF